MPKISPKCTESWHQQNLRRTSWFHSRHRRQEQEPIRCNNVIFCKTNTVCWSKIFIILTATSITQVPPFPPINIAFWPHWCSSQLNAPASRQAQMRQTAPSLEPRDTEHSVEMSSSKRTGFFTFSEVTPKKRLVQSTRLLGMVSKWLSSWELRPISPCREWRADYKNANFSCKGIRFFEIQSHKHWIFLTIHIGGTAQARAMRMNEVSLIKMNAHLFSKYRISPKVTPLQLKFAFLSSARHSLQDDIGLICQLESHLETIPSQMSNFDET